MDFEEKVKEFYDGRVEKGLYNKSCKYFSDGTKMEVWFNKKSVRDMIYSSDNWMCIEIKEAYEKYLNSIGRRKSEEFNESIKFTLVKNKMYKEFLDFEDLSKFTLDSDAKFLSGLSMSK